MDGARSVQPRILFCLFLISLVAVLIHGYHPYIEDSEIYLPAVEEALNPRLFPIGREYFASHARLSFYAPLIASSVHLTRLPLTWAIFLWHLLSIFLLLLAAWHLAARLFHEPRARWAAVCLLGCLLTLSVAGTGLYVMDEYLNPRNLTAGISIFTIVLLNDRRYLLSALGIVIAAALHPFMAGFTLLFCLVFLAMRATPSLRTHTILGAFSFLWQPSVAYEQATRFHPFHYVQRWHWYEWLGAIGPLLIAAWYRRLAERQSNPTLALLCRTLVACGSLAIITALILDLPRRFETLARLQPMRMFFLIYIVFIIISGGMLASSFLKNRPARWVAVFLPVAAIMLYSQLHLFPESRHVEWPSAAPRNPWVQAFLWARDHTPVNAVFALDPVYMHIAGEDENGFRAAAQRSRLADAVKDSGVVTMFPSLAGSWAQEVEDEPSFLDLTAADLHHLSSKYKVQWIVTQVSQTHGLDCPYNNQTVAVCRIP